MKVTYAAQLSGLYGRSAQLTDRGVSSELDSRRAAFLHLAPLAMIAPVGAAGEPVFVSGVPSAGQLAAPQTILFPIRPDEAPLPALTALFEAESLRATCIIPGAPLALAVEGPTEVRLDLALRQPFETEDGLPLAVLRQKAARTAFRPLPAFVRAGAWAPEAWPDLSEL